MICVLDLQHSGKPSSPGDRGAGVDLDGDRLVEVHEQEAALTPVYASAASYRLEQLGEPDLDLVLEAQGEYSERHARVVELARRNPHRRVAYVALHLNAGGGNYGLVVADHRSRGGLQLATDVAASLGFVPELARVVVGTSAEGSFPRAHSCVQGIYAGPANLSAIVFEPCFVDRAEHRPLLTPDGLRRIGTALANGVAAWLRRPLT